MFQLLTKGNKSYGRNLGKYAKEYKTAIHRQVIHSGSEKADHKGLRTYLRFVGASSYQQAAVAR